MHRIKSALRTWQSPKSKPRSREKARVALNTRTKNPCFPPFEEEQHNESGIDLGRRNWLFAGSEAGAKTLARAMTLIESSKMNGLDPQAYLAAELGRIHDHKINRIEELLP